MRKKIALLVIVTIFLFSSIVAFAETAKPIVPPMDKTKDRASRAMNNIFYGPVEVPKNLNETATKGTKVDRCTEKTRTGVERGIARFFTGVWQLATFWYSDPGCVTSSKPAAATTTTTQAATK